MDDKTGAKELQGSISLALIKIRIKAGISQRDVLSDTGIHIARIEAGIKGVGIYSLKKLCDYYGISLADFFTLYCKV